MNGLIISFQQFVKMVRYIFLAEVQPAHAIQVERCNALQLAVLDVIVQLICTRMREVHVRRIRNVSVSELICLMGQQKQPFPPFCYFFRISFQHLALAVSNTSSLVAKSAHA